MTKSAGRKRVTFELDAEPGSRVSLVGAFNNWDSTKNPMKDNPNSGKFVTTVMLPPGRHEYKFIVNDVWVVDPRCPEWVANGCGSLNSVRSV